MKLIIQKFWNYDFSAGNEIRLSSVFILASIVVVASIYIVSEVFFGVDPGQHNFTLLSYRQALLSGNTFSIAGKSFEQLFPHIWIVLASFCVLMRFTVIIRSYYLSKKAIGDAAFKQVFVTGGTSFLVALSSGILLVSALAITAHFAGLNIEWNGNPISYSVQSLRELTDHYVPSILKIQNYWFALLLTILFKDLPGYFIHWLSHKTRFFWLVTHRSHHAMEYLYPIASPPAFSFDFLLTIPGGLVAIAISKLIYTEPLVMEVILFSTARYCFEIFNHSIAHYQLCFNNPIIRNCTRFLGGAGVYHLVHHSAKAQDHTVNLGDSPFQLWDRVFGTYRKPYPETPPVGLTNQPKIIWNPFRIIYSGIAQLAYEWKMNKDWATRFKIIFGGVYYKPPVTKDFLIIT